MVSLAPYQAWQAFQNNSQIYMQTRDASQPQAYAAAPSFEPAQQEFQSQPLLIGWRHITLNLTHNRRRFRQLIACFGQPIQGFD